jgi:hypothetical protein
MVARRNGIVPIAVIGFDPADIARDRWSYTEADTRGSGAADDRRTWDLVRCWGKSGRVSA